MKYLKDIKGLFVGAASKVQEKPLHRKMCGVLRLQICIIFMHALIFLEPRRRLILGHLISTPNYYSAINYSRIVTIAPDTQNA
jgi:hypothetical protein